MYSAQGIAGGYGSHAQGQAYRASLAAAQVAVLVSCVHQAGGIAFGKGDAAHNVHAGPEADEREEEQDIAALALRVDTLRKTYSHVAKGSKRMKGQLLVSALRIAVSGRRRADKVVIECRNNAVTGWVAVRRSTQPDKRVFAMGAFAGRMKAGGV